MFGLLKIVSIAVHIQNLATTLEKTNKETSDWRITPFQVNRRNNNGREVPPANECFAAWPEPTLQTEENEIVFAGDIPGHSALCQLKTKLKDGFLIIESAFRTCMHSHVIPVSENFSRIKKREFKNGLLIIRISRCP